MVIGLLLKFKNNKSEFDEDKDKFVAAIVVVGFGLKSWIDKLEVTFLLFPSYLTVYFSYPGKENWFLLKYIMLPTKRIIGLVIGTRNIAILTAIRRPTNVNLVNQYLRLSKHKLNGLLYLLLLLDTACIQIHLTESDGKLS